ncbi:MAG: adenylate/guanylate cyclase domain-containing protein [Elusimicrobiota bacterium]
MASPSCALYGFPPELNDSFMREYGARSVPAVRRASSLALAIILAFAAWPNHGARTHAMELYLGFVAPGLALWIASTFRRGAARNMHRVSFVAALATLGAGNILFLIFVPEKADSYQPASVMLVTMLFYAALRLPFLWATAAGWLFAIVFLAAAVRLDALSPRAVSLSVLFLLSTNALGMYVAYAFERALRLDFLSRREIAAEREKSERLLRNVLPDAIAERLKAGAAVIADDLADVTILFADIVGYTGMSGRMTAPQLVDLLTEVFSRFDALLERAGAEKIKTIGDAYMAVCGLGGGKAHADAAAGLGLAMLAEISELNAQRGLSLNLRIGISSGPVVAGVIGRKKFSYDLWGDTVNVASRMESHGVIGRVHLSEEAAKRLPPGRAVEPRGAMEIKGKGVMTTYLLA